MNETDTLQHTINTFSYRIDRIENLTNIHLVFLVVILALLVILTGYFVMSKLLPFIKTREEKKTPENKKTKGGEPQSEVDKFVKILPSLLKEIETLQSYKSKSGDYDNLEKNLKNTIKENEELSGQKLDLLNENKSLQQKIQSKEKEVKEKINEIEEQYKSRKELLENVKKAEPLRDYAGKVFDYLCFCDSILKSTSEKINKTDADVSTVISTLLQQALLKTTEMAKWKHICSDINEKGIAIQNKDLKNCFLFSTDAENLDAFKKLCISKIKPFTSALMILCEANSNLSRFFGNKNLSNIESEYKNKITEIKSKAKEVGITEIAEVKLFTRLSNSNAINGVILFPYSTVKNLNKDDIAEIIEFGMKTEFEDLTKTKVLIN